MTRRQIATRFLLLAMLTCTAFFPYRLTASAPGCTASAEACQACCTARAQACQEQGKAYTGCGGYEDNTAKGLGKACNEGGCF
jgi:hypothetical protein